MKTKIYTSALLVLMIHAIVSSQTNNILSENDMLQRSDSMNNNSVYSEDLLDQSNSFDSQAAMLWAEAKTSQGVAKELMLEKVIYLSEQSLMKRIEKSILSAQTRYTVSDSTSVDVYTAYIADLIKEADHYDSLTEKLAHEAKNTPDEMKELIIEKKSDLHEQSLARQIEASVLLAKMAYLKFYQNINNIDQLLNNIEKNDFATDKTISLNSQAEIYLKRAKEMREEANSLDTTEGRLGAMLNAEEQEYLALEKQNELINSLLFIIPSSL